MKFIGTIQTKLEQDHDVHALESELEKLKNDASQAVVLKNCVILVCQHQSYAYCVTLDCFTDD